MSVALPEALERAATALPELADAIRPANGDPAKLLESLSPDAGARVLTWLLGNQPDAGAELAAAWAEDVEAGAAVVLKVGEEGLPKAGRKALRRTHHRLRSRGIEVREEPRVNVVATLPPIEDTLASALVSAIDPRGTRIAYLVEPNPGGGARLFELMLDEERGIVGLEIYTTGRSNARKFVRDMTSRAQVAAAEAPAESVRALVARFAAEQPADRPLPRGFAEHRRNLAEAPEGALPPGELAREALPAGDPKQAQERVVERVREGAIGPWPLAEPVLREAAEKLEELTKGKIIVSGPRRREQVEEVIQQVLGDVFGGRGGEATARRFEESAYVLWKTSREEEACDALAVAQLFRETPPAGNPVARALLDVLLAPALAGLDQEDAGEEESPLLVKP